MNSETIKKLDSRYIAGTYRRNDLVITEGIGSAFYDEKGKQYTDLTSGIGVNSFGACDDEWVSAVTAQLCRLQHTSNLYYTEPQVALAKLLCEKSGMSKVFFSNSGAEANECAIKTARKYSSDKYGDGRNVIITLENSFHGRTVTTLSATGQEVFHKDFGPFTEGFVFSKANDFKSIKKLCESEYKDKICAVMLELVQGEGGVIALEKDYVEKVAGFAADNDILLIIDEVQTGVGRTGSFYAYMQYGISPDIVTSAKGLGGGLPIGATLFGKKTADVLSFGDHGSTFGGNPVCAAGAYSIISRINDEFLNGVKRKGELVRQRLSSCEKIKNISGLGMMIGFESDKAPSDVVKECMAAGVLVLTAKNKIRLLPPLNIDENELLNAIETVVLTIDGKKIDEPSAGGHGGFEEQCDCDDDCCGDECCDDDCDDCRDGDACGHDDDCCDDGCNCHDHSGYIH